jgi:hypothetical protein
MKDTANPTAPVAMVNVNLLAVPKGFAAQRAELPLAVQQVTIVFAGQPVLEADLGELVGDAMPLLVPSPPVASVSGLLGTIGLSPVPLVNEATALTIGP